MFRWFLIWDPMLIYVFPQISSLRLNRHSKRLTLRHYVTFIVNYLMTLGPFTYTINLTIAWMFSDFKELICWFNVGFWTRIFWNCFHERWKRLFYLRWHLTRARSDWTSKIKISVFRCLVQSASRGLNISLCDAMMFHRVGFNWRKNYWPNYLLILLRLPWCAEIQPLETSPSLLSLGKCCWGQNVRMTSVDNYFRM